MVGDGANDLGMIEAAGLGVAYHAKPAVAAAAAARIDHGDLTALLYAQGYRREEFVEIRLPHIQMSCPDLIRTSITFHKESCEEDGLPGIGERKRRRPSDGCARQ